MAESLPRQLLRHTLAKWLPRGIAYPVLRGPLKGTRFILGAAAGEGGGASVYLNLVEPEQTQKFVNLLHPGQVLFDIGANVGYYSLLGSRLVGASGQVLAFEPLVRNLFYLYRHTRLNKAKNVMIVPAACSNHLAIANFTLGDNYAMGHLEPKAASSPSKDRTIVPTITVDEVGRQANLTPDVLKIDVEGAELQVLEGARDTLLKIKPLIFLSVHSAELRAVCQAYLSQMHYVFETLDGETHGPGELLASPDSQGLSPF
jgi:FkbM family methyltransferase